MGEMEDFKKNNEFPYFTFQISEGPATSDSLDFGITGPVLQDLDNEGGCVPMNGWAPAALKMRYYHHFRHLRKRPADIIHTLARAYMNPFDFLSLADHRALWHALPSQASTLIVATACGRQQQHVDATTISHWFPRGSPNPDIIIPQNLCRHALIFHFLPVSLSAFRPLE
jgi:hypothetical protein